MATSRAGCSGCPPGVSAGLDRWYVADHRHAVPGGSGYKRQVCLARMEYDEDGAIKPMDPLVAPFEPGDEGEPITTRSTASAADQRAEALDEQTPRPPE